MLDSDSILLPLLSLKGPKTDRLHPFPAVVPLAGEGPERTYTINTTTTTVICYTYLRKEKRASVKKRVNSPYIYCIIYLATIQSPTVNKHNKNTKTSTNCCVRLASCLLVFRVCAVPPSTTLMTLCSCTSHNTRPFPCVLLVIIASPSLWTNYGHIHPHNNNNDYYYYYYCS